MTHPSFQPTRRNLVKMIAGVPLLPLGSALASGGLLSGCGGDDGTSSANLSSVSFVGMSAPSLAGAAAMATTTVGSSLVASFDDKSSRSFTLGYETFFLTGHAVPNGSGGTVVAGGYYDIHNQPIMDTSVAGSTRQFFSDCPDGTSLLTVAGASVSGVTGNTVFAVVQFEYTTRNQAQVSMYGLLPSPIAVLTLNQDKATGKLSLVKYHNVDTSSAKGLWITCGASLSPWGTHLSSEEYEPDAFDQGVLGQSLSVLRGFSQNVFGDATTVAHKLAVLDGHCRAVGRDPAAITRTVFMMAADRSPDLRADLESLRDAGVDGVVVMGTFDHAVIAGLGHVLADVFG